MTDVVQAFSLTLPGGNPITTITSVACAIPVSRVSKILIVFPPGCADNVGIRIEHGGTQVYPFIKDTFFILDDYTLEVDVSGQSDSGQWQISGYNIDFYAHIVQAYIFYDYVDYKSQGAASSLISLLGR
jgi:hypothetical protein